MNGTSHVASIEQLFELYRTSSDPALKRLHAFYCEDLHTAEDGTRRTLGSFLREGALAADYPRGAKCNEVVRVVLRPCATPILQALLLGIGASQQENPDDMISRMYHFFDHRDGSGTALSDDPEAEQILAVANLLEPAVAVNWIVSNVVQTCPVCLGTGISPIVPPFPCFACGGDGHVLEELVTRVEETTGWTTTCPIETFFGTSQDLVHFRFRPAVDVYTIHQTRANDAYAQGKMERALLYLGYALHFLQDVASIPHHATKVPFSDGHPDYENVNDRDRDRIFGAVAWGQVEAEARSLEAAIRSGGPPVATALFRWASAKSAAQPRTDPSRFTAIVPSLFASMHFVLQGFHEQHRRLKVTKDLLAHLARSRAFGHKDVWSRVAAAAARQERKKLPVREKKRIQDLAAAWLEKARRAKASRRPVPPTPPELRPPPRVGPPQPIGIRELIT